MPYTLENSSTNQFKQMLLELLRSLTESQRKREQIEMLARDFELTLEGRQKEFKTRSDYYARQLVVSDPAKALAQIVSITESKGYETVTPEGERVCTYPNVDLSFVTEEMYNSISDEVLRERLRSVITSIDGKEPSVYTWIKIYDLYRGNDSLQEKYQEADQTMLKIALLKTPVETKLEFEKVSDDSASDSGESDANVRPIGDEYLESLREKLPEFTETDQKRLSELSEKDPKNLNEDEKSELSALKHAKEMHNIFEHPDQIVISEEELSNLYLFTKTEENHDFGKINISNRVVFEDFLQKNVIFKSDYEKKLHESIQQNGIDKCTANGRNDGAPSLMTEAARSLDFTSKVKVAERGVEVAYQQTASAMLKDITQKNQSINLYEKSSTGKKLKDLSVLRKEAPFLRKTITVNVYEQWKNDRAALSARQVRKNEEVLGASVVGQDYSQRQEEQQPVDTEKKEPEKSVPETKADKEELSEYSEKVSEDVGLSDDLGDGVFDPTKSVTDEQMEQKYGIGPRTEKQTRDQKMDISYHMPATEKQIKLAKRLGIDNADEMYRGEISQAIAERTGKKSPWDGFVPFEKRQDIRTSDVMVTDLHTGEQKAATIVQTPKGDVLAESENFRQMVNQIQDRVSDALKSYDRKEVDDAGSSTIGTIGYMINDVAATIDNGNLSAVADIATKTALAAMAVSTIKIDNAIKGAEEITKGVAEIFLQDRNVFDRFREGKKQILDSAFEKGSDLSLIRPVQDLKLACSLQPDMREEMQPLVSQSFTLLKKIAADDDLTREYCKASMSDLYEGQKSYLDLGVLAVMRNDEALLKKLDQDYRVNYPEVFEHTDISYIDKCKDIAAFVEKNNRVQRNEQVLSDTPDQRIQQAAFEDYDHGRGIELERSLNRFDE